MREPAAIVTALLLLITAAGQCAAEKQCNVYSAECTTNSPRLIKVQHWPRSRSYSYYYQVPRRLRKVVRSTVMAAAVSTPGPEAAAADPHHSDRQLFDHVRLTPVFGSRLSARRNTTDTANTTPESEPEPRLQARPREAEARSREAETPPNAILRRRRPALRRRLRRPDAASDDLTERANALEAATRHGSPGSEERAFRVQRLKRRRKILAKKLNRKQFPGGGPRKKIVKVVAVRKPPRVIPGLSEVYQDSLVNSLISEEYPSLQPSPGIKGFPGVDYPIYRRIPETGFSCSHQRYWGMYADTETQCQVWHYCDQDGNKHSFLCPNGTVFSQVTFICDWWFNVDCNTAVQLYVTNEALSLLPAPPEKTFPEDFNGPIVDWYIYQRHQERAYRKEKFLRRLEAGQQQDAIRFLETHDFPPWFTPRDQALYVKLKALERKSKRHQPAPAHRPVKKELTQYAPRYARPAI